MRCLRVRTLLRWDSGFPEEQKLVTRDGITTSGSPILCLKIIGRLDVHFPALLPYSSIKKYLWLFLAIIQFLSFCRPKFSYNSLARHAWLGTDGDSDWVVHLSFDSFLFSYESEFLICDWTCLLGEIGGNLGFFLGGSVLGFVDIIIVCWNRRKSNW